MDCDGVYTRTRKLVKAGNSCSFTLNSSWPFEVDDLVQVQVSVPTNPDVVYTETLKVCFRANNRIVHVPHDWGFEAGQVVTLAVLGVVRKATTNAEDARRSVERRVEEVS